MLDADRKDLDELPRNKLNGERNGQVEKKIDKRRLKLH